MIITLPQIAGQDRLATLLNSYTAWLAQVAEPVAPRFTFRTSSFTANTDAYLSSATIFYHAHVVAGAFVALHGAYVGAIAILESGDAPEVMREKLAPLFASPTTVHECIGSGTPDCLHNPTDLLTHAKAQARALGLTRFGGGLMYKQLSQDVADKVNKLLAEGPHLVELFNMADTVAEFEHLLRTVRKTSGLN